MRGVVAPVESDCSVPSVSGKRLCSCSQSALRSVEDAEGENSELVLLMNRPPAAPLGSSAPGWCWGGESDGGAITERGVSASLEPLRCILPDAAGMATGPDVTLEAAVAAAATAAAGAVAAVANCGCSASGVPHTMHRCMLPISCTTQLLSSSHCAAVSTLGVVGTGAAGDGTDLTGGCAPPLAPLL